MSFITHHHIAHGRAVVSDTCQTPDGAEGIINHGVGTGGEGTLATRMMKCTCPLKFIG